jgi:hypothetical protein
MRPLLLAAVLISAALPAAVRADIYRWVDANGSVYYGQEPPPGVKAVRVAVTPPPAAKPPESSEAKGKSRTSRCGFYREQLKMVEAPSDAPLDPKREAAKDQLRKLVKENCG